ncbi:helix-turn-helix transcriptional regulator [Kitasatospora sp. GP82]|uniref:AAA family ATPase n=1 Tax=Kitasatospora sp. GP82 TaxID=3035089 RepID=UPI0024761918|nr:helix-turn-helix transcriptional regulator [Kitasatospora sp. GP82]MDH6125729.1 DNA-binding CsgD family transcriptional regulator/tetratricopeptide (TPR) repeat protein [Kitasatospora sp. GP82]
MHLPYRLTSAGTNGPYPGPTEPLLLHRDREQAVLTSVLARLAAGRPSVVTVTGRPGFGQNALARWASRRAEERGLRVLRARATPVECELWHGVVAQLLTPLELGDDALRALAGRARPTRPAGLAELLATARERPTLLVVENAQWLDPESLSWLQALVRRSPGVPVALLASGSGVSAAGADWLSVASCSPEPAGAHELVLPELSLGEVAVAVERFCATAGEDRFTVEARKSSTGSPSVLHETLARFARHGHRPVAARVPELRAISAAVRAEHTVGALRGLCAEGVAVVRALAVCGDLLDLPVVCMLAGLSSLGEARLRAELEATGIVSPADTGRRMDPAVRARVLEEMTADERSCLYARAAELVHRAGVDDRAVAGLLLRARPIAADWALLALRRSCADALRQGNHQRAAAYLSRALEEPLDPAQRAQLTFELAAVELVDAPEAGDRRLDGILRDGTGDHAGLRVRAIDLKLTCGNTEGMRRAVAEALPAARGTERDNLIALYWSADQSGRDDTELFLPEVPPLSNDPLPPAQAGARAWQLAVRGVELETVRTLARRALDRQTVGGTPILPRLAACRSLCLTEDYAEADAGLSALLAELRGSHLDIGVPQVLAVRAALNLRRGRLAAAEQDLAEAERLPATNSRPHPAASHLMAVRIIVDLRSGRRDRARSLADAPTAPGAQDSAHWSHLLYARALVATADGRLPEAGELLQECGRRLLSRHHVNPAVLPWRSLAARSWQAAGRSEEALRSSCEELSLARRWGAPSTLGRAESTARQLVREHLASAREEVRPGPPSAPRTEPLPAWDALSQSERHTAVLAGRGHSNQHIADLLSVSRRTVELRLSRAYHKLRIDGRQELRALVRVMEGS